MSDTQRPSRPCPCRHPDYGLLCEQDRGHDGGHGAGSHTGGAIIMWGDDPSQRAHAFRDAWDADPPPLMGIDHETGDVLIYRTDDGLHDLRLTCEDLTALLLGKGSSAP